MNVGTDSSTSSRGAADTPAWTIQFLERGVPPSCLGVDAAGFIDTVDCDVLRETAAALGGELVLLGEVVASRADAHDWACVAISQFPNQRTLLEARATMPRQSTDALVHPPQGARWTFTAEAVEDIPDDLAAPATDTLDHVINLVLFSYLDPEEMERFLEATRGLAAQVGARREAWLEITSQFIDVDAHFDELFVSRYPSVEAWQELHSNDQWTRHARVLESTMDAFMDVVIAPRVNRIATARRV